MTYPAITSVKQWLLVNVLAAAALLLPGYGHADMEKEAIEEHQKYIEAGVIYDEPKLADYVQSVGERIVKVSEMADQKFTFTVLDFPTINAYAAPGGYIYLFRGLINYLTSEAQLAAVLAHEVGHITGNHHGRQKRASTTNKVLAGVLGVLTGSGDLAEASALWGQTVVSGYGREMELEADQLGAKYLAAANYPTAAMIEVISTLKDQERLEKRRAKESGKPIQAYHGLFASHPRNDQRLLDLVNSAGSKHDSANTYAGVLPFRIATEGLPWGEAVKEPKEKPNRYTNEKLRYYIDYPEGWQFNEQGNSAIGNAPEQSAQMTLQVLRRTTESPDVYIKKRLGYPLIKKSEAFTLGNLRGHRGFVTSKEGGNDQRLAVIYSGRFAYVFTGKAVNANMKTADKDFIAIINSFRPLSQKTLAAKDAKTINYVKAKPGLTFDKLAAYLQLGKYGEEELRLINGKYPVGEPEPGEWVKIIR